ncbi:MAG: polysaccharide deacetylase family protein, partial [Candidatus Paceibacterota bacterium]
MKKSKYLLLLFIIFLISCSDDEELPSEQSTIQPGVVISFDDDYINEWFEASFILQEYDWNATFFVTRFNQLTSDEIEKLIVLKNQGHEIGGHGLNHLNAVTFISQNGTIDYVEQEIDPMMSFMAEANLFPTSFAYPFGARNAATDNVLLNEFQMIRGTTYNSYSPASQNCYFTNNRLVLGLGIDSNYSHFSIPYFISLLNYAKNNNKIVVFYGHKPVENIQNNYETTYETLIEICNFVNQNNMKFYTMSELYNLR